MVTNEKKKKKNRENSGRLTTLKTDKNWIDYRALAKIGIPANIDGPYNSKRETLSKPILRRMGIL